MQLQVFLASAREPTSIPCKQSRGEVIKTKTRGCRCKVYPFTSCLRCLQVLPPVGFVTWQGVVPQLPHCAQMSVVDWALWATTWALYATTAATLSFLVVVVLIAAGLRCRRALGTESGETVLGVFHPYWCVCPPLAMKLRECARCVPYPSSAMLVAAASGCCGWPWQPWMPVLMLRVCTSKCTRGMQRRASPFCSAQKTALQWTCCLHAT